MTQSTDTPRPDPLVALLKAEERAWLDATPPSGHPLIHGIFQRLPDRLRAALDSIEGVSRPPEGTRLVLMSEELALVLGASRVEWGEPDEHGWYTPTLHRTDDGAFVATLLRYADRAHDNESYRTLVSETLLRDAAEIIRDYKNRAAASPSREAAGLDVATIVRETLDIAHAHPLWTGSEVIAKVTARLASEEQRDD